MTETLAPTLERIEAIAHAAFADIPPELARHTHGVAFLVQEFPDEEVEAEMELESPFDILGLYRGVALPHKSGGGTPADLDRIFLYRRPILDYWGEALEDIVRHVLIHEIGHHFGFSDDDMERFEEED